MTAQTLPPYDQRPLPAFTGTTLSALLRWRAALHPDRTLYTFLPTGEGEGQALTFAGVDTASKAMAVALREAGGTPGDRVLILCPPGLEYITALFGCFDAGMIGVPAYPPHPSRPSRSLGKLSSIVSDSGAAFAIALPELIAKRQVMVDAAPDLAALRWVEVASDAERAARWSPPTQAEPIAFLQYTSGSTAAPKGVMVSHANLLHQLGHLQRMIGIDEQSCVVSWLPPYHDMGLIGTILSPLYSGNHSVQLPPPAFLQRPARWLEAIARFGGTWATAPNFAYDLCVRKCRPGDAPLDLSRWTKILNGAEPVQPDTLDAFADAFATCGLKRGSLYPCYGLAEGTLMVSGATQHQGAVVGTYDRAALGRGAAVPAKDGAPSVRLSSSGLVLGQRLEIVHPETGAPLKPGEVGEVWVSGPSVCLGYFRNAEATARTFQARLPDGSGPFLRTGDLGFTDANGELFVTGRLKDLIIVNGQNHYPQDLERAAVANQPSLRAAATAAFSVPGEGTEAVVLVTEVEARARLAPEALEALARSVMSAVVESQEVGLTEVALAAAGEVPMTSSGKIQRAACRAKWQAGELELLARWPPRG